MNTKYLSLPAMKQSIKPNENKPEAKKIQVREMFDGISYSYDLLNRIITLGIDVVWRKKSSETPPKRKAQKYS